MKKIKLSIIFILLIVIVSCNKINKQDLLGEWSTIPITDSTEYHTLIFENNKIKLIDSYEFIESGLYEIKGHKLFINLRNNNRILTPISDIINDSLIIFEKTYYKGLELGNVNYHEYDLLGLKSNKRINPESYSEIFHVYKSNDLLIIRYGDRLIEPSDLRKVIFSGHGILPSEIELFVGKQINLEDLKEIYYNLKNCQIRKVNIIVNKYAPLDYRIITDYIEIFDDDLENYFINSPPTLRTEYYETRRSYLEENTEIIEIKAENDINKLQKITENKKYLVSINNELGLKNYLKLKELISNLRKTKKLKIKTEII